MQESDLIFIGPAEEGMRIDKLLAERFPEYSRTYFQNLIELGCILLNGERAIKRIIPEEGDEIEICFQAIPGPSLTPEPIPLEILYEDEHLLAINKSAGMVVHPAPGHWSGTFVNALLAHCDEKMPGNDPIRPGIVHRLDKDTTGILIAAKTMPAHQKLIEMFSEKRIEKIYLAICCGRPSIKTIQLPIGRDPIHRKKMTVLSDGREAVTNIQLAAFNEQLSLVLARPITGRTHQIRVHLKHMGCPILGDMTYGNEHFNHLFKIKRQLLHAYRLHFEHPITKDFLKLSAPIPDDLKSWMRRLCGPSLCNPDLEFCLKSRF
ncbi:MAG TPA: RluA family pseudouridine synthase [Chlamydiales bacterium]|nr:RluA family pseudouridine synthase [Chlamydiales bacterium]